MLHTYSKSSKSCFVPPDAQSAIEITTAAQELTTAELYLSTIHPLHRRRHKVPVGFAVEFLDQTPTILMFSLSLPFGPASTTRMRAFVSSARRAATTHPLVPPLLVGLNMKLK